MDFTISFSMRSGVKRLFLAILENLGISHFVYRSFRSGFIFFISSRIIFSRQNLDLLGILLSDSSESIGLTLFAFRL
jgi:hypothetical protein